MRMEPMHSAHSTFLFPAGTNSKIDRFRLAIVEIHMFHFLFHNTFDDGIVRIVRHTHSIVAHRVKFIRDARMLVSPVGASTSGFGLRLIVEVTTLQEIFVEVTKHVLNTTDKQRSRRVDEQG